MIWAGQALDQRPEFPKAARQRFPILFLDEVQDNSEGQSSVLRRIFVDDAKRARVNPSPNRRQIHPHDLRIAA